MSKDKELRMKNRYLISVIIPVYKVEPYLDRCLKSVTGQTYTDMEIILVDDGSPDNCPRMCDAWAEKDSRVRVIHKENGGVSLARNTALDAANGDFVFFVDSDDVIHPQALELLVKCQQQFQSDYVIGRHVHSFSEKWYGEILKAETVQQRRLDINGFFSEPLEKGYIHGHLMRRTAIGTLRFPNDIAVGEDAVFNYSLFQKTNLCFSILETALYCYCHRNDSAAAQKRGFEGYYLTADWCNKNINYYNAETKGYIIKEALKKCFLYRYEFTNESGGSYKKENRYLMNDLLRKCQMDAHISFKEKIVYTTMALLPFSYSLYVKLLNRK